MATMYELQVRTEGQWIGVSGYPDVADASEAFAERGEMEPTREWRVIERRGRGETVLMVNIEDPTLVDGGAERALTDRKTLDPDEAMVTSSARHAALLNGKRTKVLELERQLRAAQLDFARRPDSGMAALCAALHTKLGEVYRDLAVQAAAGEEIPTW